MNYRHGFHAGNFADVVKHATLARILVHLAAKPAAFRVLDTHAGAGRYDLTGGEATRGGEWQAGIARLHGRTFGPAVEALLAPYRAAVAALNGDGALRFYPGSPLIARALLRPQDRITCCELQPEAFAALNETLRRDARTKAIAIDGWAALNAYLPPKERRGVVVIDPPFEEAGELDRLADALAAAHRKWPTGIFLAWYPIKHPVDAGGFLRRVQRAGAGEALSIEFHVAPPRPGARLSACGMLTINPPWTLHAELQTLLPVLAGALGDGNGGFRLEAMGTKGQ